MATSTMKLKTAHYETYATGTTLAQLKNVLDALPYEQYMATKLTITNSGQGSNILLSPSDNRDTVRIYYATNTPYNASNMAMAWQLVYNMTAQTIKFYQLVQPVNGSFSSSEPTVSGWTLSILVA